MMWPQVLGFVQTLRNNAADFFDLALKQIEVQADTQTLLNSVEGQGSSEISCSP
jgi:hypothetical protein